MRRFWFRWKATFFHKIHLFLCIYTQYLSFFLERKKHQVTLLQSEFRRQSIGTANRKCFQHQVRNMDTKTDAEDIEERKSCMAINFAFYCTIQFHFVKYQRTLLQKPLQMREKFNLIFGRKFNTVKQIWKGELNGTHFTRININLRYSRTTRRNIRWRRTRWPSTFSPSPRSIILICFRQGGKPRRKYAL